MVPPCSISAAVPDARLPRLAAHGCIRLGALALLGIPGFTPDRGYMSTYVTLSPLFGRNLLFYGSLI